MQTQPPKNPSAPFDALMLVSYGGPESPQDVLPFLQNATGGAHIPQERLLEVCGHYQSFGGISPLGACNRQLVADLHKELQKRDADLPIEIGNRNWHPFFSETLQKLADAGARKILTLFTSAYTSYSGCRQYRENLHQAINEVQEVFSQKENQTEDSLKWSFARVRPFANTEGFVQANVMSLTRAWENITNNETDTTGIHIATVTHSIPLNMAMHSGPGMPSEKALPEAALPPALFADGQRPPIDLCQRTDAGTPSQDTTAQGLSTEAMRGLLPQTGSEILGTGWGYVPQHLAIAAQVLQRFRTNKALSPSETPWSLSFCSRSGPPQAKWLEPDINDHLKELAQRGIRKVIVLPLGFISDHMEVVFDLDTEALQTANKLGLEYIRAETVGTDPQFICALADLILERAAIERGENPKQQVATGTYPPMGENCGPGCCQYHPEHGSKHKNKN